MKAIALLLLTALFLFSGRAWSLDSGLRLKQLNHRAFSLTEGAPGDVSALAQTTDGTLWIGGRAGLTRFDGVRFVPYPGPGEEPLQSTNVSSLFAAPDGSLWIGFRPAGVSVLKDGRLTHYRERDGLPSGGVGQFARDRDGSMWAATRTGLAHLKGKRWEKVAEEQQIRPYGVLIDRAGTLWVASIDGLRARVAGENVFREIDKRPYNLWLGSVLAAGPDGKIWAAAEEGLVRVDRPADPRRDGAVAVAGVPGGPFLFDDEGNLWASDSEVLLRVSFDRDGTIHRDSFSRMDGLSSRVFALLEDRERNIWVGTSTGLHRFSHSSVLRNAVEPCFQFESLEAAFAPGENGALWMACDEGSQTYVIEVRDGAIASRQATPAFNVAYRDTQGTVWFGGPTAIAHLVDGRAVISPLPAQLQGRPLQALLHDRSGALWVSIANKGVFRVVDGKWLEYGKLDALPREHAYIAAEDEGGAVWFGYPDNHVARVKDNVVQMFHTRHGLEVGNLLAFLSQNGELWAGGELGFARFDGTRFVSIHSACGSPFKGLSGIVGTRNGDLWLNGTAGIVHIARQEIERVRREPTHRVACETFDYLDGVPGTATQLRPQPSAVRTSDDRIWFTTTGGVVSIDSTRLVRNTIPPPVNIWSLNSGQKRYISRGAPLQLPVDTTDLQIEYSAGSLTVPERVHFRYKLEGSDREWQDAGSRRVALYTNLGPGNYRFRVTASNNDGVWNNAGASIAFTIAPAFYQTWWFYALCALAGLAVLTVLYRIRMQQVAAQVRSRLEARLSERERIARELHDTLLQGIQGLIWRFQAATDRIPSGEPARQLMEQSLDRADKLLGESRDKVKDLRPAAHEVADLAQALATEGEQFAQVHPAKFRVSVQGAGRTLHPIVREEGFLIGREALANAFQHARATNIEAEITYGDRTFHVRIRDDGQGIDTAVLDAGGRPGHFGLIGMRERAKKLGAQIEVWSKAGAGTEIDLRVPAQVAYRSQWVPRRASSWLRMVRSSPPEL